MAIDVFMSVGRRWTPSQESFVEALRNRLVDLDLRPRTPGEGDDRSDVQPLKAVTEVMSECCGAVVVAFERMHIDRGLEMRGTDREKALDGLAFPTTWNQMEAAMAYTLGYPLLVISEESLHRDGMLEDRYDWQVQSLPVDPAALYSSEITSVLQKWKARVVAFQDARPSDTKAATEIGDRTIGELISDLRPGQFRALVVGIVGTLGAVAGTAFTLGVNAG